MKFRVLTRIVVLLSLALVFNLLLIQPSEAAPSVSKISGSFSAGDEIAISGSGFLNGPSVEVFDTFENNKTGSTPSLDNPTYGSWSSFGTNGPEVVSSGHSGSKSIRIHGGNKSSGFNQIKKVFSKPGQEVYVSYYVRVPDGSLFPAASSPKTFPSRSTWKMAWIMDGPYGYKGDDDICLPSWSSSSFTMGGNGRIISPKPYLGKSWWSWNNWMRLSFYIKADPKNPTGHNGQLKYELINEGVDIDSKYSTKLKVLNGGDNGIARWTQINFPGWLAPSESNCRPLYDDIYVAVGNYAQARVEIGDAPTWSKCKKKDLLVPTSWSNSSIQANVNTGSFKSGETVYLYVVDHKGNVNSSGYPIKIGETASSGETTTVPSKPGAAWISSN